jgi:hypothetical protein
MRSGVREQRRNGKQHLRPVPAIRRPGTAQTRVAQVFLVQISRDAFIVIGWGDRCDERLGDSGRSQAFRSDNPA